MTTLLEIGWCILWLVCLAIIVYAWLSVYWIYKYFKDLRNETENENNRAGLCDRYEESQ